MNTSQNEISEEEDKKSLNDKIVDFVSNNIVWVFLGFIAIVIILPRLFIGTSKIGIFDNLKANEIGDAIGGMTAPIIGLFSAFLVYVAFRAQIKANEGLQEFNNRDSSIKELENIFNLSDRLKEKVNKLTLIIDKNDPQTIITGFNSISKSLSKIFKNNTNFKNTNLSNYYSECIDVYNYLYLLTNEINKSKLNKEYKDYFLNELKQYYEFLDVTNMINQSSTELEFCKIIFDTKMDELLYDMSYNKLVEKINLFKSTFPNLYYLK